MARLFIRHKPVECEVEESVQDEVFYLPKYSLDDYEIYPGAPNNLGAIYVCIVNNGNCYAARNITVMGNKQIRIGCVLFNDDPSGQEMILADMILN